MRVTVSSVDDWIPQWRGNRGLEAEDQVVVSLRAVSVRTHRELNGRRHSIAVDREVSGVARLESEVRDSERVLLSMVAGIRGLVLEVDGRERALESAKDLLDAPGLGDLADEVFGECSRRLGRAVDPTYSGGSGSQPDTAAGSLVTG